MQSTKDLAKWKSYLDKFITQRVSRFSNKTWGDYVTQGPITICGLTPTELQKEVLAFRNKSIGERLAFTLFTNIRRKEILYDYFCDVDRYENAKQEIYDQIGNINRYERLISINEGFKSMLLDRMDALEQNNFQFKERQKSLVDNGIKEIDLRSATVFTEIGTMKVGLSKMEITLDEIVASKEEKNEKGKEKVSPKFFK